MTYPTNNKLWQHLNQTDADTQDFLMEDCHLSEDHIAVLCDELTRPRIIFIETGAIVCILRSVFKGDNNEFSMVSIRFYLDEKRLISLSQYPLPLLNLLYEPRLSSNKAIINNSTKLFYRICEEITDGITEKIVEMDEQVHNLDDSWSEEEIVELSDLLKIRKQISHIQRFLLSQAEVFQKLYQSSNNNKSIKSKDINPLWRELNNATCRDIEALADIRERLQILQDGLMQKREETHNKILFIMSLVSTVFLPLTFIASLLGMNVSGIPLQTGTDGFWILCILLSLIAIIELFLFRLWKWIK